MLNHYFISRDAIGFVRHFLNESAPKDTVLTQELDRVSQRQQMSYELWWQTLARIAESLEEPCLGLEIGRRVKSAHCGVLGYLFRSSRNALEALSCFKRFERLLYAGSHVNTESDDSLLRLSWNPDIGYSSQLSDELLLAALVNVMREIMSPTEFNPCIVKFTQAIPEGTITRYQEFFACEVHEKQKQLEITFPLALMQSPLPNRDTHLHDLLDQQAQNQLAELPDDDCFMERFHDSLLRCMHEGHPEAEQVARQLHLSTRSLHRQLANRDRLFRNELKALRKSMALNYLRDENLTLAEVSLLLGYAEQSPFSRAFKQWFDLSPAKWRKIYAN